MDEFDKFIRKMLKQLEDGNGSGFVIRAEKHGNDPPKIDIQPFGMDDDEDEGDDMDCESCPLNGQCNRQEEVEEEPKDIMEDVVETDKGCEICVEVGQVERKDIDITIEKRVLILTIAKDSNPIQRKYPLKFEPLMKVKPHLRNGILSIEVQKK
jgi:hypothetical protein